MSGVIAGLAISAGATGMSFIQADQQKKAQAKANKAAAAAISEAKKRLQVNYFDTLSIKKEPYDLMRDSLLSQGAQITEAARESERGAAAAAGRIHSMQQRAQEEVRTSMNQELADIETKQLTEDGRLRDEMVNLDTAEAEGAQIAASQAQNAANASISQGIQGAANTAALGIQQANLYKKYDEGAITRKDLAPVVENRAGMQAIANGATLKTQVQGLPPSSNMGFYGNTPVNASKLNIPNLSRFTPNSAFWQPNAVDTSLNFPNPFSINFPNPFIEQ